MLRIILTTILLLGFLATEGMRIDANFAEKNIFYVIQASLSASRTKTAREEQCQLMTAKVAVLEQMMAFPI